MTRRSSPSSPGGAAFSANPTCHRDPGVGDVVKDSGAAEWSPKFGALGGRRIACTLVSGGNAVIRSE